MLAAKSETKLRVFKMIRKLKMLSKIMRVKHVGTSRNVVLVEPVYFIQSKKYVIWGKK